jgi:hypothetical protein
VASPNAIGLTPAPSARPTSAPKLGPPLPHLHRDRAQPCPIVIAPRLGSPLPHLRRDKAHPCHICTGTRLAPAHICAGTGLTPAHIGTGTGLTPATSARNIPHPDWAPGMALGGCRRLEAGLETPHLTSWEAAVPHLSLPSPGHARHGNAESPNPGTCAPGLGSPLPHPRRDWTHPRSRLHRNCAHYFNAWAGSALVHAHAHGHKTPRYCSLRTLHRRLGSCRGVCRTRMRTFGHVSAPEGSLEMGLRRSSATTVKVRKHAACKAHRAGTTSDV